jgi:hypothetical protein
LRLALRAAASICPRIWLVVLYFARDLMMTGCVPPQEAVRNMHREAQEAVEKARSSGKKLHIPLRADELDRLSGMTRRERAAAPALDMPEHLANDYRAISGLDAPMASPHSSAGSYTPPDPRLVEQVEMVSSGASTPNRAFPGEEDFSSVVSVEQELLLRQPYAAWMAPPLQQPYILDASWQDFVAQLGF